VRDTFEPVLRPRVVELVARIARRRIGLVVAPAGYGKSVAVAHYLAQSAVPNAWLVVRDEHSRLLGFAWGLARALAHDVPGLERGLLGAYQSAAESEAPVALAGWFAAQLEDCTKTIVVDDLHLVLEEPDTRNFIVALIERTPAHLHWILLSRSAFDLPLGTWLAYGHADEPVDEGDLRIRPDEAAAIAQACDVALDPGHLDDLLAFTAGWPCAFIFGLRAAARGTEFGRIAVETREKLYAYLADHAFGALSTTEQQFLLETALLPVVDLDILAAAGWDAPETMYARLRRHAGFIVANGADTFAYHDLFRDFLLDRLRSRGAAEYRRTQLASAALLESSDRADLALRFRVAAENRAEVVRMLRDQASKPTLSGMVDAIDEALLDLPQELLRADPVLLGLLARTRDFRGAWEEARALHQAAIGLAETPDQRATLTLFYAGSLHIREGAEASFAALCDLDPSEIRDLTTRARLLSRLAVLRAMRCEFEEAERLATETLASTLFEGPDLRGAMLYNACLVSDFSNRLGEARTRATEALRIAEQTGNSILISRCCTLLYLGAMNDGDWTSAAGLVAKMLIHARREGDLVAVNAALQTALVLATIRGDAAAVAEADAAIGRGFEAYPDSQSARSFARAMCYAWSGDFESARREGEGNLQAPTGAEQFEGVVYPSHVAVYHAAAGDRDAALAAVDRATTVLGKFVTGRLGTGATLTNIGRVLLAVAAALLLRSRTATEILLHLEQSDPKPISAVESLAQAARMLNRIAQGVADRGALDRDLAEVRAQGLGGYADLIAALPVGTAPSAAAFGTLTKAELQMLRLIGRGGTMKAIAAHVHRSPGTVETHIRAILRKLGCKTRSEAVALARDHGIL
jgi:LuxR family maltose regulon positive regulatory protein